MCTNKKCNNRVVPVPGEIIVTCESCNRTMPVSKCGCGFSCIIAFESNSEEDVELSVHADTLNVFFDEDVLKKYKDNCKDLTSKILLLGDIDVTYDNKNIITEFKKHSD